MFTYNEHCDSNILRMEARMNFKSKIEAISFNFSHDLQLIPPIHELEHSMETFIHSYSGLPGCCSFSQVMASIYKA